MHMKVTKPQPPHNDELEALKAGLNQYNESFTGELLKVKVSSFVKDPSGKVLGGILGEIKWGWLSIEGLWVDENIRNDGWGKKLLITLEQYALSKGISNFRLETTTFQALGFYSKLGYKVYGELPDMPPGHKSYFLQKQTAT